MHSPGKALQRRKQLAPSTRNYASIQGGMPFCICDPLPAARALDAAAKETGVNFIGGYSALVQKGMTPADLALIRPPFVLLDAFFDSQSYDSILINNVQGAYHATNFLISQCRCQPGYLHSSFPISNFEERANGFYNSIRYNGMSASKSIVHKLTPSQEGAYSDMKAIIESGEELATAYFADNDLIAVGAMRALISAGYRIPEDISIVGFDDLPLCEYVTPPLTTIHVPKQYMGEKAAERLLELINTKDHYPIKIEINTQLKERSSVRLRGRQ